MCTRVFFVLIFNFNFIFALTVATSNTSGFDLGTTTSALQSGLGTGLFGAKKPSLFSAPANSTTPAFGFGASANQTTTQVTNLFGNATGFDLNTTSQPFQPAGGVFGATNTVATGNLFNKPAANTFGLTQTNSATPLFGVTPSVSTGTPMGNLFGGGSGVGGGLGTTTSLGFGNATTPFGATTTTNQTALAPLVEQLTQNARAQQHVLDMVRSMPYGQSALFRHLNADPSSAASSAPTSFQTPPANSVARASNVPVISASAAANTLIELHKVNSLTAVRSPSLNNGLVARRQLQPMLLNRRQVGILCMF